MKKRLLVFIMLLCIMVTAVAVGVVFAATPEVDVYLVMNNSVFKSYGSKYYIYNDGGEPNRFNVKNTTGEDVFYKKLVIRETLTSDIHPQVQADTVYTDVNIAPDALISLDGNDIMFYEMSDVPYDYSYNIIVTDGDNNEYALFEEDKSVVLNQLYVDFDVKYEIISDTTRIETGDAVQVRVSITSRSSVEATNVTADIYGLGRVGAVDRILPNETVVIENYLTAKESADTYVTIGCNTLIIPQSYFTRDYTEKKIKLKVTEIKGNYSMALFTEVDNYYIESYAYTPVKLTVKNTGEVTLTEVMLKNPNGENIAVIGRLEPGREYVYTLGEYFSPGTVYEFSAIGFVEGSVKAVKATTALELLHYDPKCSVKCEVSNTQCQYLDEVEVIYTVKNTGTIFLENVMFNDEATGISMNVGDLLPGEYKEIRYTLTAKESISLNPTVNALCRGFDDNVTASAKQKITVMGAVYSSNVDMYISTEKNAVRPGKAVALTVRIINLGEGVLENVSISLTGYDVLVGNIDELHAGDTKEFSVRFVPKESGTFVVELSGTDETGKSVSLSRDFDIRLLDKIEDDNSGAVRGPAVEITFMVICIILGVFVLIAFVVAAVMLTEKLTGKSNSMLDYVRRKFNRR